MFAGKLMGVAVKMLGAELVKGANQKFLEIAVDHKHQWQSLDGLLRWRHLRHMLKILRQGLHGSTGVSVCLIIWVKSLGNLMNNSLNNPID